MALELKTTDGRKPGPVGVLRSEQVKRHTIWEKFPIHFKVVAVGNGKDGRAGFETQEFGLNELSEQFLEQTRQHFALEIAHIADLGNCLRKLQQRHIK